MPFDQVQDTQNAAAPETDDQQEQPHGFQKLHQPSLNDLKSIKVTLDRPVPTWPSRHLLASRPKLHISGLLEHHAPIRKPGRHVVRPLDPDSSQHRWRSIETAHPMRILVQANAEPDPATGVRLRGGSCLTPTRAPVVNGR